ncbi:MAG: aldehyde dehydrogenase family protein [Candidatus Aminicenantes bacterium]|nr:aldehyde dehydrogenase family protein [Candidatus Aminicenantes bacterium]
MDHIVETLKAQRDFYSKAKTRRVDFRINQLKKLRNAVKKHEAEIINAVRKDLRKPEFEAWYSEVGTILYELKYIRKKLRSWVRPQKVRTPLVLLGSKSHLYPESLGQVLIIGTWNYPFHTTLYPLIGAMAAGNCAVLKPSEVSASSSNLISRIIQDTFEPEHIACIEGGPETAQALLSHRFDHIFFTGGEGVGRKVMEAAAKHLTPVTLEMGGKNPVLVEPDVPVSLAAKRIGWGKFINAGQTCLAPDYVLVHQSMKKEFLEELKTCLHEFYGEDPKDSPDYGRIINRKHFQRVMNLMNSGCIAAGGWAIPEELYISPTIITDVKPQDPIMQEEIFGPLIAVMDYQNLDHALSYINSKPKPLCMYVFTKRSRVRDSILNSTSAGSVCVNDIILQTTVLTLPFGGVGKSGLGCYHGKYSFDTFTHHKSVLRRPFFIRNNLLYPPYKGKLKKLRRLI